MKILSENLDNLDYKQLSRNYSQHRTFDMKADPQQYLDFKDRLEGSDIPFDEYFHKKMPYVTVFYTDSDKSHSGSVRNESDAASVEADSSKFQQALAISKRYGYRLDDAYNKPDNYVLRSPGLCGFTVSYGTKPAMIVPTITVSGIVSGEVDRVIEQQDKLNIAIELAKELEKLYSAHTIEESVKLEGNNVSSAIPDKIDSFLQDVAQVTNIISYSDIIKFGKKLSQSEQYRKYALGGIEHLLDRWGEAVLYEDELMMDDIAYDIRSYMTFPIQKTVEGISSARR